MNPQELIDLEEHDAKMRRFLADDDYAKAYSYCRARRIELARFARSNPKDAIASKLLSRLMFNEAMCLDLLGRLQEALRLALRANKIRQTSAEVYDRYFGYSIVSRYYARLHDPENARLSLLKAINAVLDGSQKEFFRLTIQDLESLETREGNLEASRIYESMRNHLRHRPQPAGKLMTAAERLESLDSSLPE